MTDYRNRIKALEYVNAADLTPHPGNWRCGVYAIRNAIANKVYIGSTSNVPERWRTHRKQLRANRHPNQHLQASWNQYGEGAFCFSRLEPVNDVSALTAREQHWIDLTGCAKPERGYNLRPRAESSRGKRFTTEQRARLSIALMGNTNALGTKQSQETINKRREKLCGRTWKVSEERKAGEVWQSFRKRHAELMKGRKHDWHTSVPEETRAKISISVKEARKATLRIYEGFIDPQGNPVGPIRGMADFCAVHGLTRSLMDKVYWGKRQSHKGWTVQRG